MKEKLLFSFFSFKFIVDLKRGEAVNTISFLCFMFAFIRKVIFLSLRGMVTMMGLTASGDLMVLFAIRSQCFRHQRVNPQQKAAK